MSWVVFSHSMQQWIISWSDCDEWQKVDFTWQLVTTSSVAGHRSFKAFPRTKLAQKKVMVTVWWSAANPIHYSFLITANHYTWEVRSANQWDTLRTVISASGIGQHSSPGDLPNPGIKPVSPAWQADSLPLSHLGHPLQTFSLPLWLEIGKVGSLHFFPSLDLLLQAAFDSSGDMEKKWKAEESLSCHMSLTLSLAAGPRSVCLFTSLRYL